MQRSNTRILTTHTGSLPRPRELTRLYALRASGAAADAAEIDRVGRDAVRAIVEKQRAAGIDIGNNGEQQRDSFFLYLKGRLSGLGGSWERPLSIIRCPPVWSFDGCVSDRTRAHRWLRAASMGRCSQMRMPGVRVAIDWNSPRTCAGASGLGSKLSCCEMPPDRKMNRQDRGLVLEPASVRNALR